MYIYNIYECIYIYKYECMYVYVNIFMQTVVCIHMNIYVCTYVYINTFMDIYVCIHMYIYICVYYMMCSYMNENLQCSFANIKSPVLSPVILQNQCIISAVTCTHIYIYIYIDTCIYICMYDIYTHTNIYTCTHIRILCIYMCISH